MIGVSRTESFWPETSQMKPAQLVIITVTDMKVWDNWCLDAWNSAETQSNALNKYLVEDSNYSCKSKTWTWIFFGVISVFLGCLPADFSGILKM